MDSDALVEELRRAHGAHTIILYGSRARGDASAESDIDVAAFADVGSVTRDARLWNDPFLDAFVYPTSTALSAPEPDLLKLCGGVVLLDERALAQPFLERVHALEDQGPPELPESELSMRRVWARKMIARIRRGDVEAHYRHHWLLYQLLVDHFALRRARYRGPKQALAMLERESPEIFAAFARALVPSASLEAIEALVDLVVGVRESR